MMRWVGLAIVVGLLGLGWFAYNRPGEDSFGLRNADLTRLVWLVMALLLVSGAGYGFQRFRYDSGRAIAGALFWAGLILAIVALYRLFR